MMLDTRQMKSQRFLLLTPGWLIVYIAICTLLLSGCGASVDHPLLSGSPTPDSTGTAVRSNQGDNLGIQVIDAQSNLSAYPSGSMTLTISTHPYAVCSFVVSYGRAKPSSVAGIRPITASASGLVSWHWYVENTAHTGTWPLIITSILADGTKVSKQISVNVTFPPVGVINSQSRLTANAGGHMVLAIQSVPGVSSTIQYDFFGGRLTKILTQKTDSRGIASFGWDVGKGVAPGSYPLTIITALADGEQSSVRVDMTVY